MKAHPFSQSDSPAPGGRQTTAVTVKAVDTVCPYCGVGCALTYFVEPSTNRILFAEGRKGAPNDGRLCVKGRYGFDYAMHPQRLTKPLIRKSESYPMRFITG